MPSTKDWISEYYHLAKGKVLMYWHRDHRRYHRERTDNTEPTIILIPGINSHWGGLQPLAQFLYQHGYSVIGANGIKRNMALIPDAASTIANMISELGITNAIIVGHSKGGLVGKQLLAFHNQQDRIKGLVAITTPFNGAGLADMMPFPAYKELLPGSETIQKIKNRSDVNKSIITISAEWDNMVKPEESTTLDGALRNITLPIRGHNVIVYKKSLWQTVLTSLQEFKEK